MVSVGRVLFLEGMLMRSGVEGSKTAHIPPFRGEGDTQEGGRQAAREDGKEGGLKINILGCSCSNKSGGNAKALLQFIIMKN